MNRKKISVLALSLALICGAAGCGKKQANEVETIRAAKALRIAIVETGGQYARQEGEKVVGLEPELAEYIADALKVEAVYQVCSREEALNKLTLGEADIALGCINGAGRLTTDYLFSTPYGKGYLYAVTQTGDYTQTVQALKNSSVGVEKSLDEQTRGALYTAEGIRITDYASAQTAAKAIKEEQIRAYICHEEQAKLLLADPGLQVQNIANLEPEEFVIAAPKSSQALVSGIDALIRQFLEEPEDGKGA